MKRKRKLAMVTALLVLGMVALGGCGGNSGGGNRLTKEEFATKANALCSDYMLKTAALPNSKTEAEGVKVLADMRDFFAQSIAGMKKLKPPTAEQAAVNRVITLADKRLAVMSQSVTALQKRDLKKVTALTNRVGALKKESNLLFGQLGATTCVM